jgi:carbamoyltransferase
MKFIGLHLGHDSGVAIFNEFGDLEFYGECERFDNRIKNYGLCDIDPILKNFSNLELEKTDVITITSVNDDYAPIIFYDDTLIRTGKKPLNKINIVADFVIDHHLAHAVSAWCFRKDEDEKLFISFDGAGGTTNCNLPLKSSLVGIINHQEFYKIPNAPNIMTSCPLNCLLKCNSAGKAMGLAGYYHEVSPMECNNENLLKIINSCIDWNNGAYPTYPIFKNKEDMKFVASFYKFIIEQIWINVEKNIKSFANGRGVVISGGTTLALELNTRIYNMAKDVTFGPPTNDSGLALGAAAFSYFHALGKWPKPINTASLNALQKNLPKVGPQTPKEIAKKISENITIGLLRGKSEAGPRALGFRSILAQATDFKNLKKVSQDLKQREFYRPLAPMVTSENFERYFIGPKGEYMQYRVECTTEAQKELPAIVHRDNSARPQVVYKENDPWLHELLVEYGKISGHECIINTSLNGKDKPICNTYEDALKDFEGKDIEIICIETKKSQYAKSNELKIF